MGDVEIVREKYRVTGVRSSPESIAGRMEMLEQRGEENFVIVVPFGGEVGADAESKAAGE